MSSATEIGYGIKAVYQPYPISFLSRSIFRRGLFFSLVVGLSALAYFFPWVDPGLGALFLLFGAPHGGTEWRNGREVVPSLQFCAVYLITAMIIGAIWLIVPITALVAFLAISAWHFGHAEQNLKALGVATVLGSLAVFPVQTLGYFALITGQDAVFSQTPIYVSRILGFAALAVILLEALIRRRDIDRAIGLILVLVFLPPVLAVGTIFLFFHAFPKYKATWAAKQFDLAKTLKIYAPTAIPTLLGGFTLMVIFVMGIIPALWVGAAGVALATPHILDPNDPIGPTLEI